MFLLVLCSSAFSEYESYRVKFFFFLKKEIRLKKRWTVALNILYPKSILFLKKSKEIKNSSAHTKRKELSAQQITKLFKGFVLSILLLKSVKEIENSSADYQTKEIICSMECKTFSRILTLF